MRRAKKGKKQTKFNQLLEQEMADADDLDDSGDEDGYNDDDDDKEHSGSNDANEDDDDEDYEDDDDEDASSTGNQNKLISTSEMKQMEIALAEDTLNIPPALNDSLLDNMSHDAENGDNLENTQT